MADLYSMSLDALIERQIAIEENDCVEERIMNIIKNLDDTGKELSLSLVNQVAEHQGNKDEK